MPFSFVENRGQAAAAVRFIGNGPEFKAWFLDKGVTFQRGDAVTRMEFAQGRDAGRGGVGSAARPAIEAVSPLGARANYLRGNDPGNWQKDLPLFGAIRYREVWPGIDVRFKGESGRAKAEYEVSPGASVADIRLRFDGKPQIRPDGTLAVLNASGEFTEEKPFLFQEHGEERREIAGAFRLMADGSVGFTAAPYDHTKPLMVDPVILFSGYFGGSSQSTITAVAVNSYFNTIVAGWTVGTDLPATGGAKPRNSGGVDAFVAGFSPANGALVFCTYLGGSGDDRAFGLATDISNNNYITGYTSSSNFPTLGAVQSRLKGSRDAFVAKISGDGSTLVYSTYLGGTGIDVGNAIVLDPSNAAIVIGDTTSANLATPGAFQTLPGGGQDAFVAKISPGGNTLSWLTYFGGSGAEHGAALQLDTAGAVYIGGSTYSSDMRVLQGSQPQSGGGQDGFAAKLSADGSGIVFSTYIGGSGGSPGMPESVNAVSIVALGYLVVAGTTSSANFPASSNAFQPNFGGGLTDGFMCLMDLSSGALLRATFVGGSGDDGINSMVSDMATMMYITGYTSSTDFPSLNPVQNRNGGGLDAFAAKLNFSRLLWATYLGGGGNDSGTAIALDSLVNVVVAGSTSSANFPMAGNLGRVRSAQLTSFVTRLAPNFTVALASMPNLYFDVWHDTGYNGPNLTLNFATFGAQGDIPLIADWDGSGVKRLGVFRNGTWILDTNNNGVIDGSDRVVNFGQSGDVPVLGDWNGTGHLKLGLYRGGTFILDLSGHLSGIPTGLTDATFAFGLASDKPVVGDWNSSGTSKVGVFRDGQWLIDFHGSQTVGVTYSYGQAGDVPLVGDWRSSGVVNQIGIFRNGFWMLNIMNTNQLLSSDGRYELRFGFGGASYIPLVY